MDSSGIRQIWHMMRFTVYAWDACSARVIATGEAGRKRGELGLRVRV